ncbi:MAG: hypothetical protein V1728_04320 [Candidatus Micrarchaeota archaeon]
MRYKQAQEDNPSPATMSQTQKCLDQFFPNQIKTWFSKATSPPSLSSLENYVLSAIKTEDIPKKYKGNFFQSLFNQDRGAIVVMVRYIRAKPPGSALLQSDDPAVKELDDFLDKFGNSVSNQIPDPSKYAQSISNLLALGRMYGDAALQQSAGGYAAAPDDQKFEILRQCKLLLVDRIAKEPGAYLAGPGKTFAPHHLVEKPPAGHFLSTPGNLAFKFQPLKDVTSPEVPFPYYMPTNRSYVPTWVSDPQIIIANGIQSLLNDLILYGEASLRDDKGNPDNQKIRKLCFSDGLGNSLVHEDNNGDLVPDSDKIDAMAAAIVRENHLKENNLDTVIKKIQDALDDARVGIQVEGNTAFGKDGSKRGTQEGTMAAFVMNYGLAVETMKLVNEYVLYPFFRKLSGVETVKHFDFDSDYLTFLTQSVLSKTIPQFSIQGLGADRIKDALNKNLGDSNGLSIDFSSPFNRNKIEDLLGAAPGTLIEVEESTGGRLLLRRDALGFLDVLKASKFIAVGSATNEPAVFASDSALLASAQAVLLNMDTNKIYHDAVRKAGVQPLPLNPADDPVIKNSKNSVFIRNIASDPKVDLAFLSAEVPQGMSESKNTIDGLARFISSEQEQVVHKPDMNDWLEPKLFCIPQKDQANLRAKLTTFISSSDPSTDLDLGGGLTYHLERQGTDFKIQNTSVFSYKNGKRSSFNEQAQALFSVLSKDSFGRYYLEEANRQAFVNWMAGRRDRPGENAQEIEGHPVYFYLNDINRRFIGIGAYAPTHLELKAAQPVYHYDRTQPVITVEFDLSNKSSTNLLQNELISKLHTTLGASISVVVYNVHATQELKTIPALCWVDQNGKAVFEFKTTDFPETDFSSVTFSDGGLEKSYIPDPAAYSQGGKRIDFVADFIVNENKSDEYLVMAQGTYARPQNKAFSIRVGESMSDGKSTTPSKLSTEVMGGNPGSWIELGNPQKMSYSIEKQEGPQLIFDLTGLKHSMVSWNRQRNWVETSKLSSIDSEQRKIPDLSSVVYDNVVPRTGALRYEELVGNGRASSSDLERLNDEFTKNGGPSLSASDWELLKEKKSLEVGGYQVWLRSSSKSNTAGAFPSTTYDVVFAPSEFYQTIREHIKSKLEGQSNYTQAKAIREALKLTGQPVSDAKLDDLTNNMMLRINNLIHNGNGSLDLSVVPRSDQVPGESDQAGLPYLQVSLQPGEAGINHLLIHPGVQIGCAIEYDARTDTYSKGYFYLEGEGIDPSVDYPFRFIDKPGGEFTNRIPLSNMPMAFAIVGQKGELHVDYDESRGMFSLSYDHDPDKHNGFILQNSSGKPIELEFGSGGLFNISDQDLSQPNYSVPLSMKLDGQSVQVGSAIYTYDAKEKEFILKNVQSDRNFVQTLPEKNKADYLQYTTTGKYGEPTGFFTRSESGERQDGAGLLISGDFDQIFMLTGLDTRRLDEVNKDISPYLSALSPWLRKFKDKESYFSVRESLDSKPGLRQVILSYPLKDGRTVDVFKASDSGNGMWDVVPIPSADFDKFLQEMAQPSVKSSSLLDRFFQSVPMRNGGFGGWTA